MRIPSLTPFASGSPLGWLPCIPGAYSPMNGEAITGCNSISDQSPRYSSALGVLPVPEIEGTIVGNGDSSSTPRITLQDLIDMNLPVLSPEVLSALQNANGGPRAPVLQTPTNWTPWILGGAALTGILLIVVMSRR